MKIAIAIFTVLLFCLVFVCTTNGQANDSSKSTEKQKDKNQPQEKDRPLKIKDKPYAETGNCEQSSGLATLRVTFDKSAKITNVEIVTSSGCDSFDEKAVKAAKGIKFKPAIKNGELITVVKLVQYTFRKF